MHRWRVTIWALLTTLLAATTALGAGSPVRITSQEGLVWHLSGDHLTVEGAVTVEYKDFTLACQRLEVDTAGEILQAFTRVSYKEDGDEIRADYFHYDLNSETGRFSQFTMAVQDEEVTGDLYVGGQDLTRQDGNTYISEASLTGCNLAEPHYHLQAREIEYYPDERIVARHVSYYEGRFKLFTLPYLVLSLKKNRWEAPKIGHNPEDGWFVKTTYNYYRNPAWLGSLFIDYYQLKGWGLGVRHNYQLTGALPAAGWLYLYAKENGHEDEPISLHTALVYQPELPVGWSGELKGEYRQNYYNTRLSHDWGGTARLSWQEQARRVSFSYNSLNKNPAELYTGSIYQSEQLIASFEDRPRSDLRYAFSTNLSARQRVGLPFEDPSQFMQGWVSQTFPEYTLNVKVEHKYNPIYSTDEQIPPWKSYTLLPDVRLTTRRLRLGQKLLPLTATIGASRIQEEPGNLSTMRATGQLNLTGISHRLGSRTLLNTTGNISGHYYDTNDAQLQAQTRTTLTYQVMRGARLGVTHNWIGRLGISPLSYDLAEPTHNMQGRLDYTLGDWRAYLTGGYNLTTQLPEDITAEIGYRHSRQIFSSMQVSYALPEDYWKYAKLSAAYVLDQEHTLKAGVYYDFTQDLWREVSLELSQQVNPLWTLDAKVNWDGLYGGRLIQGKVGLTRDWHCRQFKISVDAVKEELWVELLFDLFPSEPLRLGATEDQFLVDLDLVQGGMTP